MNIIETYATFKLFQELYFPIGLMIFLLLFFILIQGALFIESLIIKYRSKRVANLYKNEQKRDFANLKLSRTQKKFVSLYTKGLKAKDAYLKAYGGNDEN